MPTAFHVNGVAELKVNTGSAGALETLGHSVDGVDVEPRVMHRPIHDDAGGGSDGVPATYQNIGEMHIITADVVVYDEAVLLKIRRQSMLLATEGTMIGAGKIMDPMVQGGSGGTVGGLFRLLVLSPDEALPHNWPTVRLLGKGKRLSTKTLIYRLAFEAIPYKGAANTLAGTILYNRTAS